MAFDLGGLLGSGISAIAGMWEGAQNRKDADAAARRNLLAQYDFAQHGIQWKVQDAINAGINPLAALGASTSSFSNVAGDMPSSGIGAAGRSIGDALRGAFDKEDEEERKLDLQTKRLRNDYLQAQIDKLKNPGAAPAINPSQLMPGQSEGEHVSPWSGSSSGAIKVKPFELTPGAVIDPGYMPGKNPDVEFTLTPTGQGDAKVIADKAMRSNDIIGPLQWHARNTVLPAFHSLRDYVENVPRKRAWMQLPQRPGYQVLFNPFTGREYYQKLWSGSYFRR